jgi:hypothetical protein
MNRLPPPWVLLSLALGLLLVAAGYLLYPRSSLLQPVPVAAGEQEIAWLYPATAPANWNRFVMALGRVEAHLAPTFPGLHARIDARTFPAESAAIPEAALEWPDGHRLVFRWYKTTSEQDAGHWLRALLARKPAPLAILGGNTSDAAYRTLIALSKQANALPMEERPLMLVTTGTANRWIPGAGDRETASVDLLDLYPGRTFRFCFSNSQMARATCDFIWSQPDLRPDRDPAYLIHWLDDAYSRDLIEGYSAALQDIAVGAAAEDAAFILGAAAGPGLPPLPGGIPPVHRVAPGRSTFRAALEDTAWILGMASGRGGLPLPGGVLPLHRIDSGTVSVRGKVPSSPPWMTGGSSFRLAVPPWRQWIDSSVGTFSLPNRFEQQVSKDLLRDLADHPTQSRPLVAITGQAMPCRRFLRAIVRSDPVRGRQFVVTTGDSVSFTTLYRDRHTHWPIQDLPFPLVAFAHDNPIDKSAGFRPDEGTETTSQAGTDDLLLLEDVLLAVTLAYHDDGPARNPEQLARRLRKLHYIGDHVIRTADGDPFFDERGGRASDTGEHLICLRPRLQGERVLPEATLEVFRRAGPSLWQSVGEPLTIRYGPPDFNAGHN